MEDFSNECFRNEELITDKRLYGRKFQNDDSETIAASAKKHRIWFHADGVHSGAAIFSKKYKYLLKGIERSDSLIVNFRTFNMADSSGIGESHPGPDPPAFSGRCGLSHRRQWSACSR